MKKLIIFVSLLFLAMAYGKAEDKEVLKIATFNLRRTLGFTGKIW